MKERESFEQQVDELMSFIEQNQLKDEKISSKEIRHYLPWSCMRDFLHIYDGGLWNDVSEADPEEFEDGKNPCWSGDVEMRQQDDMPPTRHFSGNDIALGPFVEDMWYEPVENGRLPCKGYIRFYKAYLVKHWDLEPPYDWLTIEKADDTMHVVIFVEEDQMMNENTKVTLTMKQLKRFVKEARKPSDVLGVGNYWAVDVVWVIDDPEYDEIDDATQFGLPNTVYIRTDDTDEDAIDFTGIIQNAFDTQVDDIMPEPVEFEEIPRKQWKNIIDARKQVSEAYGDDETLPSDQVNEFEEHLRNAQNEVEAAARIVCNSHNPAAIQAYNKCSKMSYDIADVIHTTHMFRKWD